MLLDPSPTSRSSSCRVPGAFFVTHTGNAKSQADIHLVELSSVTSHFGPIRSKHRGGAEAATTAEGGGSGPVPAVAAASTDVVHAPLAKALPVAPAAAAPPASGQAGSVPVAPAPSSFYVHKLKRPGYQAPPPRT